MSRIRSHLARFHPRAEWTQAMLLAAVTSHEEELARLRGMLGQAPVPVDAPIPEDMADLFEYADTPAESNEKLLIRLREVMGLIGLAEDDGHRAAPELYRRKDRLESGIRWNRGRGAEVI